MEIKLAKHTPGPWWLEGNTLIAHDHEFDADIALAHIWVDDCKEYKANARLIAAAPEMLNVLQEAERIIDGPIADLLTGDSMNDTGAYDLLNLIRTTIAKAKGEQP